MIKSLLNIVAEEDKLIYLFKSSFLTFFTFALKRYLNGCVFFIAPVFSIKKLILVNQNR